MKYPDALPVLKELRHERSGGCLREQISTASLDLAHRQTMGLVMTRGIRPRVMAPSETPP
jgi:hypothetical protein